MSRIWKDRPSARDKLKEKKNPHQHIKIKQEHTKAYHYQFVYKMHTMNIFIH